MNCFFSLKTCTLLLVGSLVAGAVSISIQKEGWPLYRNDPQNLGHSDLTARGAPEIAGRFFLGGDASTLRVVQAENKAQLLVLIVVAGRLHAFSKSGKELWTTELVGISDVEGAEDLAGDGQTEIIAFSQEPPVLFLLSPRDGSILWRHRFPAPAQVVHMGGLKIANLSWPRKSGKQIIVWPRHDNCGHVLNFKDGAAQGKETTRFCVDPWLGNWPPAMAVADVNGDGKPEVIISIYKHVYVYNAQTGEQQSQIEFTSGGYGRNYGLFEVTNLDNDRKPEFAILADSINKHVTVVEQTPTGLKVRWDHWFERSYPEEKTEVRFTTHSVAQVLGEPDRLIVFSIFNATGDQRWHLLAYRGADGKTVLDVPDTYFIDAVPTKSTGARLLLTSHETERTPEFREPLALARIVGGHLKTIQHLPAAKPLFDDSPRLPTTQGASHDYRELLHADGDPSVILLRENNEMVSYEVNDAGASKRTRLSDEASRIELARLSGTSSWHFDIDGYLRGKTAAAPSAWSARLGGFFKSRPVVANFGEHFQDPLVLVQNAFGRMLALRYTKGSFETVWSLAAYGRTSKYDRADPSAVIGAPQPGGANKILLGSGDSIILVNSQGGVEKRFNLPGLPFDWGFARFHHGGPADIYVACLDALQQHGDTATVLDLRDRRALWQIHSGRLLALDGTSGKILWSKNYAPHAGFIAVQDLDGNGIDDLLLREHFTLHVLNGIDGTEMFSAPPASAPKSLDREIGSLAGYSTPIVVQREPADSSWLVVWGGGYLNIAASRLVVKNKHAQITDAWIRKTEYKDQFGILPGIADMNGDGFPDIGAGSDKDFLYCYNGKTGDQLFRLQLGGVPSDIITADLDGNGESEFLFGTDDGFLNLVGRGPRTIWRYNFHSPVGSPVVANLDGGHRAEILVTAADGYLYLLRFRGSGVLASHSK